MNYNKNILLRQYFAVKMIDFLRRELVMVYWDETSWSRTTNKKKSWERCKFNPGRNYAKNITGLTMFYAMCSDGRQYWMYLEGSNNTWITIFFLLHLHRALY